MKIKTRPIPCQKKSCISHSVDRKNSCMWHMNKKLIDLARDKEYRDGMCPYIKREVEIILEKELLDKLLDKLSDTPITSKDSIEEKLEIIQAVLPGKISEWEKFTARNNLQNGWSIEQVAKHLMFG